MATGATALAARVYGLCFDGSGGARHGALHFRRREDLSGGYVMERACFLGGCSDGGVRVFVALARLDGDDLDWAIETGFRIS